GPSRAVCRTARSPVPRSGSSSARICSGVPTPARGSAGRRGWEPSRRGGWSSRSRRLQQLVEGAGDSVQAVALGQLTYVGARDDDEVMVRRQAVRASTEGLAQQSLDTIALHRSTDLPRDRYSKSRSIGAA